MFEAFSYDFMARALVAGVAAGVLLPLLGTYLVARRYSLIADSLAHVSLAGVGLGILLGMQPLAIAMPTAILGALLLEWLNQKKQLTGDTSLAILMSGGLALAVVFSGLAKNGAANFSSYLFGSITTTTTSDVAVLILAAALTLGYVLIFFRQLMHSIYSPTSAKLAGIRSSLHYYLLTIITAIIIVLSLRIVGGLLMSALVVLPVVSASKIAQTFVQTIVYAIGFALIAVFVGLLTAFYFGIAAGGAIVLTSLSLLLLTLLAAKR